MATSESDESCSRCALCGRKMPLTRHHLIPRTRHRNKKTRKQFDNEEMRSRILDVCRPCHNHIHATIDEKMLGEHYNTRERLLEHPEIQHFTAWIRRKPAGFRPKIRSWKAR